MNHHKSTIIHHENTFKPQVLNQFPTFLHLFFIPSSFTKKKELFSSTYHHLHLQTRKSGIFKELTSKRRTVRLCDRTFVLCVWPDYCLSILLPR